MTSYKTIRTVLYLILFACLLGIVLEYGRMKQTYRQYVSYETQVETGLLTQLAQSYLEHSDFSGFETFCQKFLQNRYLKNSFEETSNKHSIFAPPIKVGLKSRITMFDEKGTVLFDSWQDASQMENHANRPEFQEIMKSSGDKGAFVTFERYSTTTQAKMFFCITKFKINDKLYLLRTGNTLQAIRLAGIDGQRFLSGIIFLSLAIVALMIFLFASSLSYYRKKLLEMGSKYSNKETETQIPQHLTFEGIIQNIQGEIDHRGNLISQERQIRDTIFQSLVEGVILLDQNGNILDVNEGASRLFDTKREKIKGKSLFGIWRNPELENQFWQNDWKNQILSMELTLNLPIGARTINVHLRSIGLGKTSCGCLLLLYDLTCIRKLENYRRDFVANVSHEIKTPLTVIMGTVEALQDGALENPKLASDFLETLMQHTKRLYALVQDVLSLSNLESNLDQNSQRFEKASVMESLSLAISCCEPAARKRNLMVQLENKATEETGRLIPDLMEQAFVNLIDNAIKYSRNDEKSEKRLTIRLTNLQPDLLSIEFIDNGPGIPNVHLNRIFERFYRVDTSRSVQTGGTGLGLAIVKHIVQLHQGTVSVKNNPVAGCTFSIILPLFS